MPASAIPRRRLPLSAMLIGGLGGAGLIAFSVGAFSFFSTLADPRARTPRPMPAAASMPDLKDGMPALVNSEPASSLPKAATLNLPRPMTAEPVAPQPLPVAQAAAAPSVPEPAAVSRRAVSEPQVAALRTGPTVPPIENAATLPEARTVDIVAPPARSAATIAPARSETVKAKPVQASAAAAVTPPSEPRPEPTSTATAVASPSAQAARKPVAAKPAVQKTAARKPAASRTVVDASDPEPAATAPASAPSDESEVPGARQFRAGIKAIGGIFGGDKDE